MEFDDQWRVLPPPDRVPYGAPSRGEEQAYLSRLHAMVRHNGHRPRTDWPVDRILNSLPQSLRD